MNLATVISTTFDKVTRRIVKVTGFFKADTRTASQVGPFGIDSNPLPETTAVHCDTESKKDSVILGYLNQKQLAEPGETRLYAVDEDGTTVMYIWLKKDGTILMGGDADNMVRFIPLKTVIEEMQNDITALKNAFSSWTPVPNDGGAALKAASATWAGTPLSESIDPAKIEEIKTL